MVALAANVGSLALGISMSAMAEGWDFESTLRDRVDLRYTYVSREGTEAGQGGVIQLAPGFSLKRAGSRARADVLYRMNLAWGLKDINPESLTHDLTARGEVEAIEDLLYIGGTAGARVVGDSAIAGNVDAIDFGLNGTQSYSLSISPSIRPPPTNRFVRFELNSRFDLVDYTRSSGGASTEGSDSASLAARIVSGPAFNNLPWDARARTTTTSFTTRDDVRSTYSAGVGYRVTPQIRLNARAGYEENDVETTRENTDGLTWSVGANWSPSLRTNVSANYGSRYFGETYSGRISHRSRRTTLFADFNRDITNRRNSRLVDDFVILVDEDDNPVIDPITGQPIVVNLPRIENTDEDFLGTRVRGGVSVAGTRTSVSVTADAENRKFEVSGGEEESYGLTASVSRRLTREISASIRGEYDRTNDASSGDSEFHLLGLFVNRRISSRTSLRLELSHRERNAPASGVDFTEKRIGVTLSTSFL